MATRKSTRTNFRSGRWLASAEKAGISVRPEFTPSMIVLTIRLPIDGRITARTAGLMSQVFGPTLDEATRRYDNLAELVWRRYLAQSERRRRAAAAAAHTPTIKAGPPAMAATAQQLPIVQEA